MKVKWNHSELKAQLESVLKSPLFASSRRLSDFLRYVVEGTLDNRADELKEYQIGVEVFERSRDFDPRVDPIVRVQAAKLRAKLLEYYSTDGARDQWVISIPRGAYVPSFQRKVSSSSEKAPDASIAVLPFLNISADAANEYFSDGLTEELINSLATVPELRIAARTSCFYFKGKNEDIRDIGSKLNVRTVLEGSVRKSENQLRITAQLINVSDGYHLWSHTFKREMQDIFAVQEEIANSVTAALIPLLGIELQKPVIRKQTTNLDAYNLYLKGRYLLSKQLGSAMNDVIDAFNQAIALDPDYGMPYAGLADTHSMQSWTSAAPPHVVMPIARKAAEQALRCDDTLAAAHVSLGMIDCCYDWKFASGEQHFLQALELDPSYPMAHYMYAYNVLFPQGRAKEAVGSLETAMKLDPFNPWFRSGMMYALAVLGRYEDALNLHRLLLDLHPGYVTGYMALSFVLEAAGKYDEAAAKVELVLKSAPRQPVFLGMLGHAYGLAGKPERAAALLEEMGTIEKKSYVSPLDRAGIYSGLRDRKKTIHWLGKSLEERTGRLILVNVDHRFRWLQSDKDFTALLRQMGVSVKALA